MIPSLVFQFDPAIPKCVKNNMMCTTNHPANPLWRIILSLLIMRNKNYFLSVHCHMCRNFHAYTIAIVPPSPPIRSKCLIDSWLLNQIHKTLRLPLKKSQSYNSFFTKFFSHRFVVIDNRRSMYVGILVDKTDQYLIP